MNQKGNMNMKEIFTGTLKVWHLLLSMIVGVIALVASTEHRMSKVEFSTQSNATLLLHHDKQLDKIENKSFEVDRRIAGIDIALERLLVLAEQNQNLLKSP